ncbi:MAG: hypothetical protein IJT72_11005 [Lachnospiraceae bacterium]|nr:hypothetical protein [Lachnospiraceae bacterium]
MIDLSNYPNLNNLANSLGGVRKAALNKKLLEKSENSWRRFSQEEIVRLEEEVKFAKPVIKSYVTPTAILYMTNHAFFAIPVKDIIWVYVSTTTMKMNFIPYNKVHNLFVVTRDGQTHNIGSMNTGGFSKKRPCDPAVMELQSIFAPVRPGILYGYSDQIAGAVHTNPAAVAQEVDMRSGVQPMQQGQPIQQATYMQ